MKMNEFIRQVKYFICAVLLVFIFMYVGHLACNFISKISADVIFNFLMLLCFLCICFCTSQLIQLHVYKVQRKKLEESDKKHSSKRYNN